MGQILSSRPDFMPPQYIHHFTELQDRIPPVETALVQEIVLESLKRECPVFLKDYDTLVLDPVALGSASIGQVHRAMLHSKQQQRNKSYFALRRHRRRNNPPKEVAVKVMHHGSKTKFRNDFQVFRWLCRVAIPSWLGLVNALEEQVMTEFDYRNEAIALKEVRSNMRSSTFRNKVCVPEPMKELTCENVLVMEMLHGKKLIDSIQDKLTSAMGGNKEMATSFLTKRRHEILTGEDSGSREVLLMSSNVFGKIKLLFLFEQCRRAINLLVDVHGYQIFRTGKST